MRNVFKTSIVASCLALGMVSISAFAADTDTRVETTSVPAILENLDSINTALTTGDERLSGLSDKDKAELAEEQAKVRKLLSGKGTLGELSSRDRLTAYNSLEVIHGLVSGNKEDRVVCRREHTIGSNRPQTNCMTAREREEVRKAAVQAMAVRGKTLPISN